MTVTILGQEIHVQPRLMVLGMKDAIRLSKLEKGEKVYIPDDRPRIDGEIYDDVIKEFIPPPPTTIRNQYIDAIRGHDPNAIEYEKPERRRYIII